MDTLAYFVDRFGLDLSGPSPIEIPNVGRNILGSWFRDLGFKKGAEIGVEGGLFSKVLLDAHPRMKLYCVDAWENYRDYHDGINKKDLPAIYLEAQERLRGYNVEFVRNYSSRAARHFDDCSLDFVYIDANHDLPFVMDDIINWDRKVRPGGIVAGHDYIRSGARKPSKMRVVEAVGWYTLLKPIRTWFLLGTQAKVEGQIRDNHRTWMWVK